MKKAFPVRLIFVLAICLLNLQNSFAQTLTCQTNCPKAGEVFSIRTSSPVLNTGGANQVWNFAVIEAVSPVPFLVSYKGATSVPASSLHPQADLVRTGITTDFLTVGNSGVFLADSAATDAYKFSIELPLPFAYGSNYTETIISTSVIVTDTFVTTWNKTFQGYGTGTLVLPSGTFPDVLCIKFNGGVSTTKNGLPDGFSLSNISFYYYSQNISYPLLYTRQLFGQGDFGSYTQFLDHVVVGVDDETMNGNQNMTVYPNPATDLVTVEFSEITKGIILLKNSLGQQVMEQKYEDGGCKLNLAGLPNGLYIMTLVGDGYTANKKMIISR